MLRGYLNFLIPFLVKDCIFFLRPSIVFIQSSSLAHFFNSLLTQVITFFPLSSERELALIIFLEILSVNVFTYLSSLVRDAISVSNFCCMKSIFFIVCFSSYSQEYPKFSSFSFPHDFFA